MKGKMKNPEMVCRYFSDLRKWIIALALLFAVTYLAVLHRQSTWVQYTVVPACFLIIFMLNSRYYLLWMKAKKDIRREEITEENIIVQKIYMLIGLTQQATTFGESPVYWTDGLIQ